MKAFILDDPSVLRAHLARTAAVLEPRRDEDGSVRWLQVADPHEPFDASLAAPYVSPKGFFFAEREPLFVFDRKNFRAVSPAVAPFVLFGVRACDLAAIAYQDAFFANDAHYQARRAVAVLVGADCDAACSSGFCAAVDAGPGVRAGSADLIVSREASGSWLVFEASERGECGLHGLVLDGAGVDAWTRREARLQEVSATFEGSARLRRGMDAVDAGRVPRATWEALALRCFTCAGCTAICPTCSCFAPLDVPEAKGSLRERTWDSCLFAGFQKEASGHHGSPELADRVRRFWFHKLAHEFAARGGRLGCVGCGRCDAVCPGGIGARSTLTRIAAEVP